MVQGVVMGQIQMTPSDSPDPKKGVDANSAQLLLRVPSYNQFFPKICCHGNEGRQGKNLSDTIE